MSNIFKIGDRLKDIEDSDFFYEGFVIGFKDKEPIYKIDKVVVVEEYKDDELIGKETTPLLWYIEKINS